MKAKSFYQELMDKGYSRRDFLKFCGMMGAMLGLQSSGAVSYTHLTLPTTSRV